MLNSLISHNEDLLQLKQSGHHIEIRGAYLIIKNIPYVEQDGAIKSSDIVTNLQIDPSTNKVKQPDEHTVWWTGKMPYTAEGKSLKEDLCCGEWEEGRELGEGISVYMEWSRRPKQGKMYRKYKDYYEKIKTYVDFVSFHAESKMPGVLKVSLSGKNTKIDSNTRFEYMNTSSYRNGTKGIEDKVSDEVVAVIGVGGTGSYLVDILAKTDIKELHLYDNGVMETDSVFRLAGAVHKSEFNMAKVSWHKIRYENVRKKGLHIYENKVDSQNIATLKKCSTVFIAVDDLEARRKIQKKCNEMGIFHLSVGIGVEREGENDNQLGGMIKVEREYKTIVVKQNKNAEAKQQQPINDIYKSNIQTAELNMLGAALAIIEWKIKKGIYRSDRTNNYDRVIYSTPSGNTIMK